MVRRCSDKRRKDYVNYGGRGIKVSEDWKNYKNFKRDMYIEYLNHKEREEYTSLDRIDSDGEYSKENCRWSTREEQVANKKGIKAVGVIEYNGQKLNSEEWSKKYGYSKHKIYRIMEEFEMSGLEAVKYISNPPKSYPCPACTRKFNTFRGLGRHKSITHGIKSKRQANEHPDIR